MDLKTKSDDISDITFKFDKIMELNSRFDKLNSNEFLRSLKTKNVSLFLQEKYKNPNMSKKTICNNIGISLPFLNKCLKDLKYNEFIRKRSTKKSSKNDLKNVPKDDLKNDLKNDSKNELRNDSRNDIKIPKGKISNVIKNDSNKKGGGKDPKQIVKELNSRSLSNSANDSDDDDDDDDEPIKENVRSILKKI